MKQKNSNVSVGMIDWPQMTDSLEKFGISGWKKATLALVSEPGHHVAWLSSSALTVAAWLIG